MRLDKVEQGLRRNENNTDFAFKMCDKLGKKEFESQSPTTIDEHHVQLITSAITHKIEPRILEFEQALDDIKNAVDRKVDETLFDMESLGTATKINDIESMTATVISESIANILALEAKLTEVAAKCQKEID